MGYLSLPPTSSRLHLVSCVWHGQQACRSAPDRHNVDQVMIDTLSVSSSFTFRSDPSSTLSIIYQSTVDQLIIDTTAISFSSTQCRSDHHRNLVDQLIINSQLTVLRLHRSDHLHFVDQLIIDNAD